MKRKKPKKQGRALNSITFLFTKFCKSTKKGEKVLFHPGARAVRGREARSVEKEVSGLYAWPEGKK